ncbi:hypothetical protein ACWD3J_49105 [Streptomyces sp. NPDC002755]|uniref:hypothetical protein n=1 Tax=Streptomyces sp. NPDC002884 TaxID=3154544 RepID=UPI0033214899
MSSEPWTIESIRNVLSNPVLVQEFLGEINRTPAHQLLGVFARWERIAKDTLAAAERGRQIAEAHGRGEDPTAEWADVTDQVLGAAERIRSRGAA